MIGINNFIMKIDDIIKCNEKIPIREAPEYATWNTSNWANDYSNIILTKRIFLHGSSRLGTDPSNKNIRLLKNHGDYAIVDVSKWKSYYYAKVEIATDAQKIAGTCYRQKQVWAADKLKRQHITFTYPSKIFFDTLLKYYKCMITDNLQTDAGRDFWFKLIEKAIKNSMFVYHLDNDYMKSAQDLVSINDPGFPKKHHHLYWGVGQIYQGRHFIISKKKLK